MRLYDDTDIEIRQNNVKDWLSTLDEDVLEAAIPYDLYRDYLWDKMFTKNGEDYVSYRDFEDVLLARGDLVLYLFSPLTGYDDIPRLYHDSPFVFSCTNEHAVIGNVNAPAYNITGRQYNNISPAVQAFFHIERITPTGVCSYSAINREKTPCGDKTRLIGRSVSYFYERFKQTCETYFSRWYDGLSEDGFKYEAETMFGIGTDIRMTKGSVQIGETDEFKRTWNVERELFVDRVEQEAIA